MSRCSFRRVLAVVAFVCLSLVAARPADASTHRRFTLILDFSTCVIDPADANVITCDEKDGTGRSIGQITVTFQRMIATDGTCATNPGCAMSWHEGYVYTLEGGTMTVASATAWQEQAIETDETGSTPLIGFSIGAVTGATGRYKGAAGTLTMRWDGNVCICLFEITQPS